MLKAFLINLLIITTATQGQPARFVIPNQVDASAKESKECEALAITFSRRIRESGNLRPLFSDLFVKDFIRRYIHEQLLTMSNDRKNLTTQYFVPGLEYDVKLLKQSTAVEWQHFYVATHTFIYQGFAHGMDKVLDSLQKDEGLENIQGADLYPQAVVDLLDKDPILTNLILMKNRNRIVNTREEMLRVTGVLKQALSIIQQERSREHPEGTVKFEKMLEKLKEIGELKPQVEITEQEYFGYPKGTRIYRVVTPAMFQLTLVRAGNELKILWAEPFIGD